MFKLKSIQWTLRYHQFNIPMLFKHIIFLVCSVELIFFFPSARGGSFNQKWSLCQGCSGSGSRASPRGRRGNLRLLSGAGRGLHLPPPPPAGQAVSHGGRGSVAWCWRLGCAGGRRSGGTRLCSSVLDPAERAPKGTWTTTIMYDMGQVKLCWYT